MTTAQPHDSDVETVAYRNDRNVVSFNRHRTCVARIVVPSELLRGLLAAIRRPAPSRKGF